MTIIKDSIWLYGADMLTHHEKQKNYLSNLRRKKKMKSKMG